VGYLNFVAWIATLNLVRMGFTKDTLIQNPKLSVLAKDNPRIATRFGAALAADLNV
jgi:hypothetical protein